MIRNLNFFLAMRLACSRRNNNLIASVILLIISFVPLVVVLQVIKTMEQGILSRYVETSSYHFKIFPLGDPSTSMHSLEEVRGLIKNCKGVKNVVIERNNFGLVTDQTTQEGVLLRGLEQDFYLQDSGMRAYLKFEKGSSKELNLGDVFIGEVLAQKLQLKLGDMLRLLVVSSTRRIPLFRVLKVTGIFSVGYYDLNKGWVLLNEGDTKIFPQNSSQDVFLGVKINNPFSDYRKMAPIIQKVLPPGWFLWDWKSLNAHNVENFRLTTLVLFFVFGLMVAVVVMMNASSLYVFFLSRRLDIALFKALGFSPHQVRSMFITLGFFVGLIGVLGGYFLGSMIALNIRYFFDICHGIQKLVNMVMGNYLVHDDNSHEFQYLPYFRTQFQIVPLLWTGFGILGWSTMVNFFPSSKISKMKVIEIVRKL